jgi:hypothetical protein
VQNTKAGKNIPNDNKIYQMNPKIPKGCKVDQTAIKYTTILHCIALQNLPKFGIFV